MECKLLHCDRQVGRKGARGLCPRHYQYLLRTGTPTKRCATCDRPIDRAVYCDDDCKPRCEVEGCVEPIRKRDWCASHYDQHHRTGQEPTPFAYKWGSDDVSYSGVHMRLRGDRGPAAAHGCAHGCGRGAAQWAYDHSCPNERQSDCGPYSTDLDRYMPLCHSCHKLFDLHGSVPLGVFQ